VRESPALTTNRKIAHNLAKSGLPVFPCKSDKSPHKKMGFKAATTNKKQIDLWWDNHPDALPGLPTGAASGMAVLDIDRKDDKDGFTALSDADLDRFTDGCYV
jgi:hypothetical protein